MLLSMDDLPPSPTTQRDFHSRRSGPVLRNLWQHPLIWLRRHVPPLLVWIRKRTMSPDYTKRLPPEILAQVFLTFLANAEADSDYILSYINPPWLLSQVCSRWRAVALSTRRLWCSLLPLTSRQLHISVLALASAHIERSNPLPLKLHLDLQWWFSNNHPHLALLDLLPSQASRWGDVHIRHVRVDYPSRSILKALRSSSFTSLETLRLDSCDFMGEPSGIVFPILTSLTLAMSRTTLLNTLSTPLLRHFALECPSYLQSDHHEYASSDNNWELAQ
ncbi:hypothetical protein B0H16DRAFT_1496662 [Mycena metata]|uniref:F-box domain-containing protein n=1 Tax=Mycena metata TaxID=1033252 RepID=A0AAD7K938_9AGAR|nr:hypothetical protein B0H16DRAFT_1496662 [Mycena metata]